MKADTEKKTSQIFKNLVEKQKHLQLRLLDMTVTHAGSLSAIMGVAVHDI